MPAQLALKRFTGPDREVHAFRTGAGSEELLLAISIEIGEDQVVDLAEGA